MDMKRFFLYAIAIAALALAGCGGNGGSGTPPGDTGTPPGDMTGMPPVDTDDMDDMDDDDTGTGCNLGGADLECTAAAVAQPIADPDKMDGPGGDLTGYSLSIPAIMAVAGGEVKVDGNADGDVTDAEDDTLAKDDMGVANAGEFGEMDYARPARDDFVGSVHQRTTDEGKVTDTLTVYSDVKSNADQAYQMYYSNVNEAARLGVDTITDAAAGNVIAFDADVTMAKNLIMVSAFPSGDSQTFTYVDDNDATEMDEEKRGGTKHMGTFHGIPGEYACTAGTCTVMSDGDGNVVGFGGTWGFTPTKLDPGMKHTVQSVIKDADYLTFGYWLKTTEKADGSMDREIQVFSDGSEDFTWNTALTGKAIYNGAAVGLYAQKTGPVGSPTIGSSGHFTADATLTAYFGQKDEGIAPNLINTISGTINNFEDAEGNNLGWSVDLNKTGIDTADGSIDAGTTTGNGSWTGAFYGNPDVPTTDRDETDNYPTGVAGEFNAHLGDGHVVGAYGATR